MRNECIGIINLEDKKDTAISQLTELRPVASVPIGGRYRVIDFVLSNMVHSGINNVSVFSKEKYRSLTDHLNNGKSWDLSRKKGGLFIFSPENTNHRSKYPYKPGDIHGILSNIDYIEKCQQEYVLIAPSYMICNIDYREAFEYHKNSDNDITIVYKNVDNANKDFDGGTTVSISNDRVVNMGSNVKLLENNNISMETYIIKRSKFIEYIYGCVNDGSYLYIEDFISNSLDKLMVGAYEYKGYLKCINSIKSYFEMNKELLDEEISGELLYSSKKVLTKEQGQTPTIYTEDANIQNSIIASGCVIEGSVKNSVIFRKVHIKKGATVENSVVMKGCTINEDSKLENVILDKFVNISKEKELKGDEKYPIVIEKDMSI